MTSLVTMSVGVLASGVALVYLVTRVASLQFGAQRLVYVLPPVCLAAGCVYVGVTLLGGSATIEWFDPLIVGAALGHLAVTRQSGSRWAPADHMSKHP